MSTKTVSKKKKDVDSIFAVKTLQEAKEKIYSDIQNGINYRDIVKTKFDIDGTAKTFNISQINQIKAEFEPKNEEKRTDSDKAAVFRLFYKGFSAIQIIIKNEFSPDFVKQCLKEYAELNNMELVPKSFFYRLKDILIRLQWAPVNNLKNMLDSVEETVNHSIASEKYFFDCSKCGKAIKMDGKPLVDARKYLSKYWYHDKCAK
ncbi:MAG: hypothetical protein K5790_02315 [Nitrosopumilus sp.]|uniref:hypothetical protein n=1 Tax=Nitrosopumilus sp. TaxID=2024843 RepID=UPI00247EA0C1|nr:hypothetical protein [Nitrosopumilus sp.]MCV0392109.1 hypothetical protein [Nitrosopumilus sp.]